MYKTDMKPCNVNNNNNNNNNNNDNNNNTGCPSHIGLTKTFINPH